LIARPLLDQPAKTRNPSVLIVRHRPHERRGKPGFLQHPNVPPIQLLGSEVFRVSRMRVDQDNLKARTAKHRARQ
jgi:hypothetical protein